MRMVLAALILLFAGFVGSANGANPQSVSIVSLVADPQRFDGQFVRVIAYLRVEFEGTVLYLHREDYEQAIIPNGIWIALSDTQMNAARKLSNSYVIAEGIFSSKEKGHMDMWSGSLHQVTRLDKWQSYRK